MLKKCDEKYGNRKRFFSNMFRSFSNAMNIVGKITVWPFIKGDLAKCKHGAGVYYEAVASFGHVSYEAKSPAWCEQACAKKAGDPEL